jgi:hypothetical protein
MYNETPPQDVQEKVEECTEEVEGTDSGVETTS